MADDMDILNCPHCRSTIIYDQDKFNCTGCSQSFPVVDNIPILAPIPYYYLAKMYYAYQQHITLQQKTVERINHQLKTNSLRKQELEALLLATTQNLSYFLTLEKKLRKLVDPENLFNVFHSRPPVSYALNLDYLNRDWSWSKETEHEIQTIISSFKNVLGNFVKEPMQRSAFLGAGTGRLALELSSGFDSVWCIDYSFTMAYFYQKVLLESLPFYKIVPKNRISKGQLVTPVTARLNGSSDKDFHQQLKKIRYIIGDAAQAPFASGSFDAIFSIYFSDVVPFQKLVKEVKRLLKPGGLFIHFGPLDFHFDEIEEMLAYEEIKDLLISEGFTIGEEKAIIITGNEPGNSLSRKTYTNQMLVAKLGKQEEPTKAVGLNSCMALAESVSFKTEGVLGGTSVTSLSFTDGLTLHQADHLFEIIKLMDGERTLGEIFTLLGETHEIDDRFRSQATSILSKLHQHGHVRII
jgi:SAM-dependent methyltransferase